MPSLFDVIPTIAPRPSRLVDLADARRDPAREPGVFVSTPLGTVHAVVRGQGPDVILIHGVTENAHTFHAVQTALEGEARVHAIDMPGHGLSDIPGSPWNPSQMAAWTAGYLDANKIDRAVVVGWSMGGTVGIALAGEHRARVSALVLEGAAAFEFPFPRGLSLLRRDGIAELLHRIGAFPPLARLVLTDTFARGYRPSDDVVDRYFRAWQVRGRAPYMRSLLRTFRPRDATSLLDRIEAPTWVVHGEHDRLVPVRIGHLLGAGVKGAKVQILRDTGHAPHTERPEVMVETIRAAIRSSSGASADR